MDRKGDASRCQDENGSWYCPAEGLLTHPLLQGFTARITENASAPLPEAGESISGGALISLPPQGKSGVGDPR